MSPSNELIDFREFIDRKLSTGTSVSLDDAVDEFRASQMSEVELNESVAAIKHAMAEIEAGVPGVPAKDVLAELRARFGSDD